MAQIMTINLSALSEVDYRKLYEICDEQRQKKADRFLRQEDRLRCVAAGALLRYAVFRVLGRQAFEVEAPPMKKPRLKDTPDFHFNLSHCGQWAVIAYDSAPVGIDVEQIVWDSGKEKIVCRFFAEDEQEYVFDGGEQSSAERFFQIWTAKESYLKYLGTGLLKSLTSFSVLQITTPQKHHYLLDGGYSMTLWAEGKPHSVEQLTVDQLLKC